MNLNQAKATAIQYSRHVACFTGREAIIEVRQIGANEFTYCERGTYTNGMLIGAYKNGAHANGETAS